MRLTWLLTLFAVGLLAVALGAWRWLGEENYRREFNQAQADMAAGRIRSARQRFVVLKSRRPQSGEVAYELGLCEEKLGHLEAALDNLV